MTKDEEIKVLKIENERLKFRADKLAEKLETASRDWNKFLASLVKFLTDFLEAAEEAQNKVKKQLN